MFKQADITFAVSSQAATVGKSQVQFSTQDRNSAKLIFKFFEGKAPLNLVDVTPEMTMITEDGSKFVVTPEVTENFNGVMEYTLKPNEIRHYGRVSAELTLKYPDDKTIGGFEFGFTIKQAMVDRNNAPLKEYYVQDLETIKKEVQAKADSIHTDIDSFKAGVDKKTSDIDKNLTAFKTDIDSRTAAVEEQVSSFEADVAQTTVVQVDTAKGEHANLDARIKSDIGKVTEQLAGTSEQFLDVKSMRNVLDYSVKNDGTDTEEALNALPGGFTYVFPSGIYAVKGFKNDWYAGFKPKNNTKYIFLPGAKIKVLPNNSRIYSGIYINGVKNFEIVNLVIEGDRSNHDFTAGGSQEFGHGIYLEGASVGEITNPAIYDTTGDGIDLLCTVGSDLRIIYPTITNVRRNGISVESVDKLLIDVPKIDRTNGISPEAGIDIEPWTDTAVMNDVIIRQATCTNSNGAGISISSLDRCANGYHIRIDKPKIDGLKLGHAMSSLKGEIIVDNPIIQGGKIGITIQSKPNAKIVNPTIEIDPSKIDYTTIPSPIYFYDGTTSGNEVGELIIENAELRNTVSNLHPVYFGRANVKNVNITFKRCDIANSIMWDSSSPRSHTNVNIGLLPIPAIHKPTGNPLGSGSLIKRKITNKGATGEVLMRIGDVYHFTPFVDIEFECVSPFRLSVSASASYLIYPFGKSVVFTDQVGARIKLKYALDGNGSGAFYATEMIGTWIGT